MLCCLSNRIARFKVLCIHSVIRCISLASPSSYFHAPLNYEFIESCLWTANLYAQDAGFKLADLPSQPPTIHHVLFKLHLFLKIVVPWYLRQDLNVYLWLSWNFLSKTGWSQVHRDPPVSVSQVLGLKFWATYYWSVWHFWRKCVIVGGRLWCLRSLNQFSPCCLWIQMWNSSSFSSIMFVCMLPFFLLWQ